MVNLKSLSIAAVAATAFLFTGAAGAHAQGAIEAAVANENRSADNRERDGDRKPGEVLAFFEVEPGAEVLDLFSGGGYFTEVLANVAGDDGKVYAHNRGGERFEQRRAALEEQYAPFGNIELIVQDGDIIPLPDDSVDFVLFSLILHHYHYDEENPDAIPANAVAFYSEVKRVLRPGGVFGVIEHSAVEGSSRAQSAGWHRIDPQMAIDDITSQGFEFAGDAAIHVNADDDMANVWFETGLRGKTNRLVHRYVNAADG